MNKTLRIFLCALLATSPMIAVNTNQQPKESFIKRNWKLAASSVSGAIAGFSLLNVLGAMVESSPIIYFAENDGSRDALVHVLQQLPYDPLYPEHLKQVVEAQNFINGYLAEQLAQESGIIQLFEDKYSTPLMFWMTVCGFSTIAAVLLYNSWNTPTMNSTEEQKPDNELPKHCYYE